MAQSTAIIATNGTTTLVQVANQYAMNGTGGVGPTLKYQGSAVTVGQFGIGVAPIGAVQTSSGYQVAWSLGGKKFIIYNYDSGGNYLNDASLIISSGSYALQSFEASFGEDLNNDGTIGLKQIVIASNATTALVQAADQYLLNSIGGVGPTLKYKGIAITTGQFGVGVAPIGAVQTSGGYQVAWSLGGNQFTVYNNDVNGNYISNYIGINSGASFALQSVETVFGVDLNNDGLIGPKLTTINGNGITTLVQAADQYFLNGSGGTITALSYQGSPVTAGQFGVGVRPIGAVQTSTGYQVAWSLGENNFIVYNSDISGNYVSNSTGVISGTSFALQSVETTFGEDLNNDGMIGPKSTTIGINGVTTLVQVADQYALNGAGGTGPTLRYQGNVVSVGQFGAGVAPIGAMQTSSGFQVAWRLGGNQFVIYNNDVNGNYISSATGVISGNSPGFTAIEAIVLEDLNGDGTLDLSSVTTSQTVNLGSNNASVNIGLNQPSLTFIGTPKNLILGSGVETINYALQASSGIAEISNFTLGRDVLNIDMLGFPSLALHDTSVGGVKAISLTSGTDELHGIVLLNVSSTTANNLLTQHTIFTGGHIIIT